MKQHTRLVLITLLLLIRLFSASNAASQEPGHIQHHNGHHHTELGASLGWVYLTPENENAVSLHLHVSRMMGDEGLSKHLGVGIGLEAIFSNHMHYGIQGTLIINPAGHWMLSISPGLLLLEEHEKIESRFSMHFETGYEFDLGKITCGPVIGTAFAGDDRHFSIGIHFGKGF